MPHAAEAQRSAQTDRRPAAPPPVVVAAPIPAAPVVGETQDMTDMSRHTQDGEMQAKHILCSCAGARHCVRVCGCALCIARIHPSPHSP